MRRSRRVRGNRVAVLLPIALLAIAFLAIPLSRRLSGDYFHPAALVVAIWSLSLGLFLLYLLPFVPPASNTIAMVLASMSAMALGAVAGQWLDRRETAPPSPRSLPHARAWLWGMSVLGLCGVAWYVVEIVSVYGWGGFQDAFTVRTALSKHQLPSTFLFLQLFCIIAPVFAVALRLTGTEIAKRDWIGPIACALGTWITTERGHFFLLTLTAFFMFVLRRGRRLSWLGLIVACATVFTLLATNFLVVGLWTGKSAANLGIPVNLPWKHAGPRRAKMRKPGPIEKAIEAAVEKVVARGTTIYLYTTGSHAALGQLMREPAGPPRAMYTIYPVTRVLERLHVIEPRLRSAPLLNIIQQPGPVLEYNVYTMLYEPLVDFGPPGAVVYSGVIGVVAGIAYARLRRRRESPVRLLVAGQIATALALSIFANRFTNTLSWYVFVATITPFLVGPYLGALGRTRGDARKISRSTGGSLAGPS